MDSRTVCHLVAEMPNRSSDKAAVKYFRDNAWLSVSWKDYFNEIEKLGLALKNLNLQVGDRVALMSNTRWEWSISDYAIMGIRCVTVPIYQTVIPDDLAFILNNSQAKVLILENKATLKVFNSIRNLCPTVEKVYIIEGSADGAESWTHLKDSQSDVSPTAHQQFLDGLSSSTLDDTATIIYTSGTTGRPKGVVLTHRQITSEVTDAFPMVGVSSSDTSLTFLPYAHVVGRLEHWGHAFTGHTLAYAESIERVKNNLVDVQPTFMIAVPRIFEKVYAGILAQMDSNPIKTKLFNWAMKIGLKASQLRQNREPLPLTFIPEYLLAKKLVLNKVKQAFGGRIRFCVSGGAPLAKEIAMFFHACDVLVLEGYGLTETSAAITLNTPYDYNFGAVGKPVGDVKLKIAEDGEILVKSNKVMKEYYLDPEATKATIVDGWFHTGDIGEITAAGDLRITDRKKDLIKTAGGKYVAPQRLENLLKMNAFVSQALIHGDQRKYIVAILTLEKDKVIRFAKEKEIQYDDFATLTQHPQVLEMIRKGVAEANAQLASFESIKRFSVLPTDFTVEAGELTPSLKVKRKFLDQKFKKQIESLYI